MNLCTAFGVAYLFGMGAVVMVDPNQQEKEEKAVPSTIQTVTAFQKVTTKNYTLETPKDWEITEETSFGQREIIPKGKELKSSGSMMSSMTGPGLGRQSWEQLHATSMWFISRSYADKKVTSSPVKMVKTKLGYEAATWSVMDEDKNVVAKYVVLKNDKSKNILALSVKAKTKDALLKLEEQFSHMVDTAIVN